MPSIRCLNMIFPNRVVALLLSAALSASPAAAQVHYESLAWTPSGDALVVSVRGDIYALPIDGGGARRLTDTGGKNDFIAWTPDGSRVAFASSRDGDSEIMVAIDVEASLHPVTSNDVDDSTPAWAPSGHALAFMRREGGHWDIWTMNADGTGQRRLMEATGHAFNPVWSPDGKWLLFEADRDGRGTDDLYLARPDGSGVRRLTDTPENEIYPQWSPDGKEVVFCAIDGGRAFVRALTLEGTEVRTLVEDACHPVWSPDGTRLAYVSSARGQPERLWIADPNGKDPTGVAPLEGRSVEKGTLLPRGR